MVGGGGARWEAIGRLQFDLLVAQGLRPHHVLLDIGCGSFRGGCLFIPYLERGHYLGIEKQAVLVREGREKEIPAEVWTDRQPQIVISDSFDFSGFDRAPDFAIAQSVFTHLRRRDIERCLSRLRTVARPETALYATFFEADTPRWWQILPSHSSRRFEYTRAQMLAFGERNGWRGEYLGDWNHPADQKLVRYTPA